MPRLLFDYLRLLPRLRRRHHREMRFDGVSMSWPEIHFSTTHYQRYMDFFGLKDARETERVHPLYFYVLGQRAQLRLLAHKGFPFAAGGLVHMGNEVQLYRPLDTKATYTLNLQARCLALNTAGYELEIATEFTQDGEQVATNRTLALARAPLRRKRGNSTAAEQEQAPPENIENIKEEPGSGANVKPGRRKLPEPSLLASVSLVMPEWAGKRYARISGDFNPIHLTPWLSRLFGFRRPIAHGMYSLMRAVSVVERQEGMQAQHIVAEFVRPVYLPSTSGMAHEMLGLRCHFELTDRNGHLQLRGNLS